jgi:hypothetical protein
MVDKLICCYNEINFSTSKSLYSNPGNIKSVFVFNKTK